jgi:hypothetical protein
MKNNLKKCFAIFFFLLFIVCNAQVKKLDYLRTKNKIEDKKKLFLNYLNYRKKLDKIYPPQPIMFGDDKFNKLVKFYSIPPKQRLNIYPFRIFDSIYFCTYNFIDDKEPRNYLDSRYHNYLKLLTTSEINKITNIMFNYFKMEGGNVTVFENKKIGCKDIYREYPKMMLLFKKNGKYINYIAFPENGTKRSNFYEEKDAVEYWKEFDLCAEKEDLILKMFGFDRNYN